MPHTSPCAQHAEAKQHQNIGLWSRERLIVGCARRQVADAHLLEDFQQSPLIGRLSKGSG